MITAIPMKRSLKIAEDGGVVVYDGPEIEDRIFVSKRQAAGEAPCNW